MPPTHLLYLHGFRSSPQSAKAQLVARWVQAHNTQHPKAPITWACPQLPPSPRAAMALLEDLTATWPAHHMAVIGSSLGGYYATAFAKRTGCRAWLINPAVAPARDLAAYMKQPKMPHPPHENGYFQPAFVDELLALNPHPLSDWLPLPAPLSAPLSDHSPSQARIGVLIAKGDEVLDWREMHAAYAKHPSVYLRLLEGGDHTVSDFDQHLPEVLQFFGFAPTATHG